MKNWNELRAQIPPARRKAIDERVAAALKELPLHRLREARRITQKQIAEAMRTDRSCVSKIERTEASGFSSLSGDQPAGTLDE